MPNMATQRRSAAGRDITTELSTVLALLAGGAFALALRRLVWFTLVRSESMFPTLRPGRRVLTIRVPTGRCHRGDIVVATLADRRAVVKRLIGLPGERVDVGTHGVRVDGVALDEPYVRLPGGPPGTFLVPPGHYFLLGDNRKVSADSRSWPSAYVPDNSVKGRCWGVRNI